MTAATVHEPQGRHQSKTAAASGWIGSALEYYDFFIYATAASLVFPQIFFASGNPTIAIVASLATYGVGYVARPIGAVVLGHWGDTHGRKNVLLMCLVLMGLSTTAVGLLPTYQQAGIWAPVLLVVLRLIQGFAVAGEISGASSMILEHAPFGRRGYFASFTLQGVQAGQILAAAVFLPLTYVLSNEAFASWGWRVPFLLSVLVLVAGYVIRREVEETPAFAEERGHGDVPKTPVIDALTNHGPDMLRVICMALMNVIPVVATIFGAAYAVQPGYGVGFDKSVYLWIPVVGNIVAVMVIPFVGDLSDRIGRRPPMIVGSLLAGLLAFAYLYAISIKSVPLAFVFSILMWGIVYQRAGLRDGDRAEHRHHADRSAACAFRDRCASRIDERSDDDRGPRVRRHDHFGDRRMERARDLSRSPQRSGRAGRPGGRQGRVRSAASAESGDRRLDHPMRGCHPEKKGLLADAPDGIENLYSWLRAVRRLQLRQNRDSPCYPLLTGIARLRRARV
jgi:MFS family permease